MERTSMTSETSNASAMWRLTVREADNLDLAVVTRPYGSPKGALRTLVTPTLSAPAAVSDDWQRSANERLSTLTRALEEARDVFRQGPELARYQRLLEAVAVTRGEVDVAEQTLADARAGVKALL